MTGYCVNFAACFSQRADAPKLGMWCTKTIPVTGVSNGMGGGADLPRPGGRPQSAASGLFIALVIQRGGVGESIHTVGHSIKRSCIPQPTSTPSQKDRSFTTELFSDKTNAQK